VSVSPSSTDARALRIARRAARVSARRVAGANIGARACAAPRASTARRRGDGLY
jgi:hypothetical protein